MSAGSVEVVRRVFEAQARDDWDSIPELYDPSIEWEDVSGLWGDWGTRRGLDDVRGAFASWFEAFEGVAFLAEEYLDAGEEVVVFVRIRGRGRGSGLQVDQRITMVWTVSGGKVARVRAYRDRGEALEAAGLRA
jgi:ketosteroid isomerase-like protein